MYVCMYTHVCMYVRMYVHVYDLYVTCMYYSTCKVIF